MKCVRCERNKDEDQFHRNGTRLFTHCIECGKTGTLKPPKKPDPGHHVLCKTEANARAFKYVKDTRQPCVLFHDERGLLSIAPCTRVDNVPVTRNLLAGYEMVKGKVKGRMLWS
ncbi:MAG: hypothetical protein ACXABY_14780 [Candidatus Thorarchaeota archaeon]|jgi:hypothetical protein